MKNWILAAVSVLFLAEVIYFNVMYDYLILALLLITAIGLGSFFAKKISNYDRFFIQLAVGFGVLGCILWLSTLYSVNEKSVFFIGSMSLVIWRFKAIKKVLLNLLRISRFTYKRRPVFLILLIIAFEILNIPSLYPIWQYDSLAKHIAIPLQMLQKDHWDYNVVEFLGYGDYAILSHLFYYFLLALGSKKALVLLNMCFSISIFLILLRLSQHIIKHRIFPFILGFIYFTTPLIYSLSTIFYIDIVPIFFLAAALLLFRQMNSNKIVSQVYIMFFLLGSAFYAKQTAIYLIVPITFVAVYYVFQKLGFKHGLKKLVISFFICIASFLPTICIIWFKTGNPVFPFMNTTFSSEYFPLINFEDPFNKNPLTFSIGSLLSIVFHTSENVESLDGGLGYYLLLIPFAPIVCIFAKNKYLLFVTYLCFTSYFLSIQMTYNIRYFFGTLVLCTLLSAIVLVMIIEKIVKIKWLRTILISLAIIVLVVPNLKFIVTPANMWGIKKGMFQMHEELITNENERILAPINRKGVRVLSNNDPFRGTFLGEYYTLTWYNWLFTDQLQKGEIHSEDFLKAFDYYLVDKTRKYNFEDLFSMRNPATSNLLTKVGETQTHDLFQVNQRTVIIDQQYPEPLRVNSLNPQVIPFKNISDQYQIDLELAVEESLGEMGRWQINWMDNADQFISTSLVPFRLDQGRKHYRSDVIKDVPINAVVGLLYLTSHDKNYVYVYSVKLTSNARVKANVVDEILKQYGKKWPYLVK